MCSGRQEAALPAGPRRAIMPASSIPFNLLHFHDKTTADISLDGGRS